MQQEEMTEIVAPQDPKEMLARRLALIREKYGRLSVYLEKMEEEDAALPRNDKMVGLARKREPNCSFK
jgi:hypothetical protein